MEYTVTIHGKGGHGSRPDKSCNPVDCFAAAYSALQLLGCTVSRVDGGTAGNIIPEALTFTCICQDPEALRRIAEHTCAAYGCRVTIQ